MTTQQSQPLTLYQVLELGEKVQEWCSVRIFGEDFPKCYGDVGDNYHSRLQVNLKPKLSFLGRKVRAIDINVGSGGLSVSDVEICRYNDVREQRALDLYARARDSALIRQKSREEESRKRGLAYAQRVLARPAK